MAAKTHKVGRLRNEAANSISFSTSGLLFIEVNIVQVDLAISFKFELENTGQIHGVEL